MKRPLATAACLVAALVTMMSIPASAQRARITARQVIERIRKHVGVAWRKDTVDTFKAGDPDTVVTGIAVTMMSTLDVLRHAVASAANLVITHEPTFYGHLDQTNALEREGDKVYAAKAAYIREHHLVIWRFHDHWHMRQPDGIMVGMVRALGWEKYSVPGSHQDRFVLPETTLASLASDIKRRLRIRTMRVVGDPEMKLSRVALAPGAPGFEAHRRVLQRDDVEAIVMGEGTEWETIEYGTDAAAEGKHKALLILGHIPSEQAGMEECARWLKTFVTEAPITFVPTAEPFWSPH